MRWAWKQVTWHWDCLNLLRVNLPILSMHQVPCNCIEQCDAKCSATHVHPSAAIKHIGQLLLHHLHLVRPPFPSVLISLHVAVLKTPLTLQNLLPLSFDSSMFAGRCNQTCAAFNLCTCANLSSLSMREMDTHSGSCWAGDWVGIGYGHFLSLSHMFLLFFRSSFPTLPCYSTFYLNPSRIAPVTLAFNVAPTITLSNLYLLSSITLPFFFLFMMLHSLLLGGPKLSFIIFITFPPFMLTVTCSLACSLVPLNCIKALAVWQAKVRQLWPHCSPLLVCSSWFLFAPITWASLFNFGFHLFCLNLKNAIAMTYVHILTMLTT